MKKTDKNTEMKDSKIVDGDLTKNSQQRRKLLTALGGGGVLAAGNTLPENWTKPVIDSVLLPAHAATTGEPVDPCVAGTYTITSCSVTNGNGNTLSSPAGGVFPLVSASMGGNELESAEAILDSACSGIAVDLSINYTSGMGGSNTDGPYNAVTTASGVAVFSTITSMAKTGTAVFTAANNAMCEVPFAEAMMSM